MNLVSSFRSRAAAALCAGAFVAFAPAVQAQEFIQTLTNALGITSEEKPEIEYRERAPLVVPPQANLRQPEANVADRRANWPQDPDVLDRKRKAEEAGQPSATLLRGLSRTSVDGAAIRPGENIQFGRRPGGEVTGPDLTLNDPNKSRYDSVNQWIPPDTLRAQRAKNEEVKLAPGVEPPRRYLTDPPVGARMPASNAPIVATQEEPRTGGKYDNAENPIGYIRQTRQK
jgi:hypothetical protein